MNVILRGLKVVIPGDLALDIQSETLRCAQGDNRGVSSQGISHWPFDMRTFQTLKARLFAVLRVTITRQDPALSSGHCSSLRSE